MCQLKTIKINTSKIVSFKDFLKFVLCNLIEDTSIYYVIKYVIYKIRFELQYYKDLL